jgi:hypothetical protein
MDQMEEGFKVTATYILENDSASRETSWLFRSSVSEIDGKLLGYGTLGLC